MRPSLLPTAVARGPATTQHQQPITTGVRQQIEQWTATLHSAQCPQHPALAVNQNNNVPTPRRRGRLPTAQKARKARKAAKNVKKSCAVENKIGEINFKDPTPSEKILEDEFADKRHTMSCSDWVKAQDTDPAIKHMKEFIEELRAEAPNKIQPCSEIEEVKDLCSHWNCLEIVRGVVSRVTGDLTSRKPTFV